MQRFLLTLGTLLLLSGAYFPYAWGVGLLIKSDAAPVASDLGAEAIRVPNVTREPIENERVARQYFPGQDWMPDAKIQLRDGNDLFCYASRFEQTEAKNDVRFEPFALVTFTKDGPLAVLAQSAVVRFQREIDLTSPSPGRIIEAKLEGDTVIRGANNLYVEGRHFVFSAESSRIWSDNAVKFAFDQHSGESDHGIQIDLVLSDVNTEKKPLAIEDVRSVHLLRHVVMNLAMPEGTGMPSAATSSANSQPNALTLSSDVAAKRESNAIAEKPKVVPVRIECQGSFRLDRRDEGRTAFAVFDEKVKVRRTNEDGKSETLEGQTLEVTFARDDAVKADESADGSMLSIEQVSLREDGESSSPTGNVKFKPTLLVVRGTPAIFRSEASQSYGTMAYARYDAVQRMLALSNSGTNPSQLRRVAQHEAKPVYLKLGNSELEAQQIGLKHDANNNPREIVCRGAGWLRTRNEVSGEEELHVAWRDQLRKYQDATSPLDVIDLTGAVVVEQPKQNARVTANYMKLWMEPLDFSQTAATPSDNAPRDEPRTGTPPRRLSDSAAPKRARPSPQPRRLWAVKDVVASSPQFKGTTQELAMWFEDVSFDRRSGASKDESGAALDLSFGKSPIRKVSGTQRDAEFEPFKSDAPPQDPFVIDSKLIRVLVVGRGPDKQADVGEVYCEGGVTLTQPREAAPRPLTIKAEQLHLRNQGAEKQVVHLLGQPARLDDPQLDLQGREIYFDRHRNLVWVDGQGELKLPVNRDFEGQPLAQPQKLAITWNEQMVFDGLVATFTGRVIAGMQDSTMKCQKMEVRMRQRLKFEQGTASMDKDPISTVVCRQEVEFDSRLIVNSSLNQVRKGRAAAFAMNLKTGRAEAKGPGVLQVWRRGQGKIAGLAPIAVADSNRATRVKDGGWDFTQIEFADELIGLQEQRSTTCKGQVQVAYGPVLEPLEVFDVDRLPKDAFLVSCDSLQMTQPQQRNLTGKEMIELVAEGNAWLEGRSFSGQADVISYDSANDLFMLRSLGENDSELTRELKNGGNRVPTIAKTIQFSRSRNVVDVDKVRFSTGLQ